MLHVETLIFPIVSMMGLAFLYSTVLRTQRSGLPTSLALGLLFGSTVVLAMIVPIRLGEGLIFDLRGLLVGLSLVLGGWVAGAVTLGIALACRVIIGGAGMSSGLVGLLLAFGIGAAWRLLRGGQDKATLRSDAFFGVVITSALAGLLVLPAVQAYDLLRQIIVPVLIGNVLGAMGLGYVLRREAQFVADAEKLRQHASLDPLTQLLNRRGAAAERRKMQTGSGRGQALFYFDLDRFKVVNDIYGHEAGDAALAAVATRIGTCVREQVVFSRHGGDEFTLFMPNVGEDSVVAIAERFRRAVRHAPLDFHGTEIDLSISVGVSWAAQSARFEDMLRQADAELMRAKALGRDRVCFNGGQSNAAAVSENWTLTTAVQ